MLHNFLYGIIALANDMGLFLRSLFYNSSFIGFFCGVGLTLIVTAFVLTKNPRHIPLILKYSSTEGFKRISPKNEHGIFQIALVHFLRMYTQVRLMFLGAFIAFCLMVTTVIVAYKP